MTTVSERLVIKDLIQGCGVRVGEPCGGTGRTADDSPSRVRGRSSGRRGGYRTNERKILSLVLLDAEHATPGEEVTILCGEPGGGSRKPRVEPHQQTLVRATVAPVPPHTGDVTA